MVWWVLGLSFLLLAVLILRSEYEKKHFVVEYAEISTDKVGEKCRLIFLSDLHNNVFGEGNRDLLKAIDEAGPDAVLAGGDMMICKGRPGVETAQSLLLRIAEKYPVFLGNGNHETRMRREREIYGGQYEEYTCALQRAGVTVLEDCSADFGAGVRITGLDLEERFYRKFRPDKLKAEEIREKVGPADREKFQILLCHSPLYFSACRFWGADLTLAGHFHGGTIRLPFLGGVMTPQYQFFLPWCAGEFQQEGRYLIVSRGLGTHSINIRLNDRPQLLVVDIKPALMFTDQV